MAVSFRPPRFGVNIHTRMRSDLDVDAEALHAERLGLDLVTLHGDVLHGTAASYETWTLLTWVAARTTRISIAPVVLALPNRHPAVLAKMAEVHAHHHHQLPLDLSVQQVVGRLLDNKAIQVCSA